jgi:hypothetical protein
MQWFTQIDNEYCALWARTMAAARTPPEKRDLFACARIALAWCVGTRAVSIMPSIVVVARFMIRSFHVASWLCVL